MFAKLICFLFKKYILCDNCGGGGIILWEQMATACCPKCDGKGYILKYQ
jgi:hypothetical protein